MNKAEKVAQTCIVPMNCLQKLLSMRKTGLSGPVLGYCLDLNEFLGKTSFVLASEWIFHICCVSQVGRSRGCLGERRQNTENVNS